MTNNEYLQAVLSDQTLPPGGSELADLQRYRQEVESCIRNHFQDSDPTIRYGGSKAKGTMIRESYDLDLPTHFGHDDDGAGETLEEIFNNVADALADDYSVERRRSALRLHSKDRTTDTHIDVVPGRFFDGDSGDVWIYQNQAEKCRLKTNLDTHISHIRDSGLRPAIRLAKLWNVRESIGMKTFVLELSVINVLKSKCGDDLTSQFKGLLEEFRDRARSISVIDPANENNDLSPAFAAVLPRLESAARTTIERIEFGGWESVFGSVSNNRTSERIASAVGSVAPGSQHRPWGR